MDSIQFLFIALKKRFNGEAFIFFFILVLFRCLITFVILKVSAGRPALMGFFAYRSRPRAFSSFSPMLIKASSSNLMNLRFICFIVVILLFTILLSLICFVFDTAKVGPFTTCARGKGQKNMLYNIFLDPYQKFPQPSDNSVSHRRTRLSAGERKTTQNGRKKQEIRGFPAFLPSVGIQTVLYFSGVCSSVATRNS